MEKAMRRHFFHHSDEALSAEKQNCHWCQIRAFATHSQYPITIVNTEDDTMIDPNFRFMESSTRASDIEPTRKEFLTGCDCKEDIDCRYSGCTCLQDAEDDSSVDDDTVSQEASPSEGEYADDWVRRKFKKKAYAYHSHGAKAGHLRTKVLMSRNPIYECHESCVCSLDCSNRVVEKGRKLPLQIFRTENRGWGVRSTVDIKKGQFVDKYMGEIITAAEATRRRAQSHIAQRKDVYLFALDKFSNPDSFDERLKGPPLEVDGEFVSGPTRFINHSCEPNLRIFARVGDHADKHLHDLAFFAARDIPRGEELTFDYVDGVDDSDMDALDPEKQKDMARCLCGSKNCRGYLW
ncbi:SET domain-containing protein [Xylaria sp. FL0933]|nr:SET domain-containing protein [Xylaria sp. FL0933]